MNCRTLNHSEETPMPITIDIMVVINNFNLNGNFGFLVIFDAIQTFAVAKMKKNTAAIANNLILVRRVIKKICSNPNALNHNKSVTNVVKPDTDMNNRTAINISILTINFVFIRLCDLVCF